MERDFEEELRVLQDKVQRITAEVEQARQLVKEWTDASTSLSHDAAQARAKNQGAGRGIGGALLGSRFRSAMRQAAAQSNAAIAREVAERRARISEGKRAAQDQVRQLQAELGATKERLRSISAESKMQTRGKAAATRTTTQALTLLKKLKEAHDLGLLTEEEYEQKRQKIKSEL